MAVITTAASAFEDEPYEPVELTNEEAATFVEAYERVGSIRGAVRLTGFARRSVYLRRYSDPLFRFALESVPRTRRLELASDELYWSMEAFNRLGMLGDGAEDELINGLLRPDDLPQHRQVDQEQLAAARERLSAAGLEWCRAIVQLSDYADDRPEGQSC